MTILLGKDHTQRNVLCSSVDGHAKTKTSLHSCSAVYRDVISHTICARIWCVNLSVGICSWLRTGSEVHYSDVIMGAMASQMTSLTIIYWTVYSSADQRKHRSSVSLPFVQGIHRWPVNSPHKRPVTRKRFPFDDVIMNCMFFSVPMKWALADMGKLNQ